MGDVISTLKENWGVIAQAPLAFAIWTVILLVLLWGLVTWVKGNQIGNLESRLALKDGEIADYKRKLDGATPDEAKARIDSLEARLNLLAPRRVSAEQREQIRVALASDPGAVQIGSDMACPDAPAFAAGLSAAFQSAGWTVSNPSFMGLAAPPVSGLGLRVANPAALTPKETFVATVLRGAGIVVDVQPGKASQVPHAFRQVPDIELVITPRVLD